MPKGNKDAYAKLRKNFRTQTSKLTRWIYQDDIKKYFLPPKPIKDKNQQRLT